MEPRRRSSVERVSKEVLSILSRRLSHESHGNGIHEADETTLRQVISTTTTVPVTPNRRIREQNGEGGIRRQVFAALAASVGAAAYGAVWSWTATALPDLRRQQSLGVLSEAQEAWIGPIALLGAVASCLFAGWMIERLGRRNSIIYIMPFYVAGWLLIAFAQNLGMMLAGRFLTGMCIGAGSIAIPVFLTEIANVEIRGALTSGFDVFATVGILYIFLVGTWATWQVQALASAALPITSGLLMLLVPESPRWLVQKGRVQEAGRALGWFRALPPDCQQVEDELAELGASVKNSGGKGGSWGDLFQLSLLKPVTIALALMFFQQASGIDAVMLYTVDIFRSAGSDIDENLSTNIVGLVQMVVTMGAALVVDRCGRRALLLISGLLMVISLAALGLYFHLKGQGSPALGSLAWLPLTSLMVYIVAFSVGFGPIPWVYMAEVLPPHVKGLGSGLVTVFRWLLGFIITLVFGDLVKWLGDDGAYWLFGSLCLVGAVYVWVFVPETKGKTLDEIQLYFVSKDKSPSHSGVSGQARL